MKAKRTELDKKFPTVRWHEQRALAGNITRGDRTLVILVQDDRGKWAAMAVEGPAIKGPPSAARGNEFMADHGHKIIGVFKSGGAALVASEKYAAKWWRRRGADKSCMCDEIQ